MSFFSIFAISIIMISFVFAAIGVKILLKRNGEFSGTCASQNPLLNKEGEPCGLCGAKPEEKCQNKEI